MTDTMRAWRTTGAGSPSEVLELRDDVPVPEPGPGTVRIEVTAAGLGLPDAFMCQDRYALTPPRPFTQGQEVTGRIAALGPGVTGREVGDRVMAVTSFFTGAGSFAEQCLGLDDFCLPVPDDMSDAEAACFLIPMHTAWVGLVQRARLAAGETLLVLGASGGTGSAAVQLGAALGARVVAVAGGPEKAAFCASLGAHEVVDRRSEDVAARVQALTEGRGADVVYDPVGGDAFREATRCIAHEGRLLAVGFASGSWGKVDVAQLVTRNYSVVGVIPSHYDRAFKESAQAELLRLWREGRLGVRVDELVPFDKLPDALERLLASGVQGKLALAVRGDATR